jgi:hypothetical protein
MIHICDSQYDNANMYIGKLASTRRIKSTSDAKSDYATKWEC